MPPRKASMPAWRNRSASTTVSNWPTRCRGCDPVCLRSMPRMQWKEKGGRVLSKVCDMEVTIEKERLPSMSPVTFPHGHITHCSVIIKRGALQWLPQLPSAVRAGGNHDGQQRKTKASVPQGCYAVGGLSKLHKVSKCLKAGVTLSSLDRIANRRATRIRHARCRRPNGNYLLVSIRRGEQHEANS